MIWDTIKDETRQTEWWRLSDVTHVIYDVHKRLRNDTGMALCDLK